MQAGVNQHQAGTNLRRSVIKATMGRQSAELKKKNRKKATNTLAAKEGNPIMGARNSRGTAGKAQQMRTK